MIDRPFSADGFENGGERILGRVIVAGAIGLFFGVEIGYVWANGAPEAPQTWALIAGVLAICLVLCVAVQPHRR